MLVGGLWVDCYIICYVDCSIIGTYRNNCGGTIGGMIMRGSTSLTVLGIAALVVLGLYIGLNSEGLFSAVYSDYFHFDLAKGSGTLTAGATGGTCYNSNGLWGQDAQLRSYWQDFYDYSLPTRPDIININPSDYYYDASSTIGLDVGGCFVKATNVVIEKSA